jgi:hypothetical protein
LARAMSTSPGGGERKVSDPTSCRKDLTSEPFEVIQFPVVSDQGVHVAVFTITATVTAADAEAAVQGALSANSEMASSLNDPTDHPHPQENGGSSFSPDSPLQYLTRVLPLDCRQASHTSPLPDPPPVDRSLEWVRYSATSTRGASPSPLPGLGRAVHQAQPQSLPLPATARPPNKSLRGREPPSASPLGMAMHLAVRTSCDEFAYKQWLLT